MRPRYGLPCAATLLALGMQTVPTAKAETDDNTPIEDPLPSTSTDDAGGGPKVDVYGYADFGLWVPLVPQSNPWLGAFPSNPSFAVGNLNLYLDSAIAPKWRSLMELRFMYSPQGNRNIQPDGRIKYTDNTVTDLSEFGSQVRWGGISIERAWLEYQAHELLNIRGGSFLTPYGIWNVDHGSPTLIGIRRPYIISEGLFPERQTGLEFWGAWTFANSNKAGYHLTLSNGRGPMDAFNDLDANKAIGGRLFFQYRGEVTRALLGGSFYTGTITDRNFRADLSGGSVTRTEIDSISQTELSLAADLRLQAGGLEFLSEFVSQQRRYEGGARGVSDFGDGIFLPDVHRWGFYGLTGYRFSWLGLMPYLSGEYFHTGTPGRSSRLLGHLPIISVFYAGLNIRPIPAIVFKIVYGHAFFPSAAADSWGRAPLRFLQLQAAWAF